MSMSSLSSRRLRRVARDWSALPRDILLEVFFRLGPLEVMLGAELACTAWRRAALAEPSLWRRIGMEAPLTCFGFEKEMRLAAVDRAAGQCEAFGGPCDDEDLLPLVTRAPSLRSLSIEHYSGSYPHSRRDLVDALQRLTLLEDLEIDFEYRIHPGENMLRFVCQACPRLRKLVLKFFVRQTSYDTEPIIDGAIPMMCELRTLKLYDCDLQGKGLKAILDSCPLLETLYITGYFWERNKMDEELMTRCTRVKNLTLPNRNTG